MPHPAAHGVYVTGHLAALDLATGRVIPFPIPVMADAESPLSPVYAAW